MTQKQDYQEHLPSGKNHQPGAIAEITAKIWDDPIGLLEQHGK